MSKSDAQKRKEKAQRLLQAANDDLDRIDGKLPPEPDNEKKYNHGIDSAAEPHADVDAMGREWPKKAPVKCSAHNRSGLRCGKYPVPGATVCKMHGGSAPQVKAKARARLENAADLMAKQLLKMAVDDSVNDSVKLTAIRDALDRAGISAKTAVDVSVQLKPWEQIAFDGIEHSPVVSDRPTAEIGSEPTDFPYRAEQTISDDSSGEPDFYDSLAQQQTALVASRSDEPIDAEIVDLSPPVERPSGSGEPPDPRSRIDGMDRPVRRLAEELSDLDCDGLTDAQSAVASTAAANRHYGALRALPRGRSG